MIEVYTDGSVLVNPNGPGGWAFVVVRDGDAREQVSGHSPVTTNNIMEMQAVLEACLFIPEPERFTIVSDSEYVVKGINEWMPRWKSKGWRKGGGAIANLDLWKLLDQHFDPSRMTIVWVRGHDGQVFNEIADELAGKEAHCYA